MCDTSSELSDNPSLDSGFMCGNDGIDGVIDGVDDEGQQLLPYFDDLSTTDSIYSSDNELSDCSPGDRSPSVTMTLNINTNTGLVLTTTKTSANYCDDIHRRYGKLWPQTDSLVANLTDENQTVVINGKVFDLTCERYSVLSYEQVCRLDKVMDEVVPIYGRGNFPTLEIRLKDLIQVVKAKLEIEKVPIRDIRLNGGAASHVLEPHSSYYNDLDLIFGVDLSNQRNFDKVRTAVLDSLLDFLPDITIKKRLSTCSIKEGYVHKMVKVTDGDRWSLISLSNKSGRNVEIKFVDQMKRQYEFSVDSFHIILDSLLQFYECSKSMPISENFYPTVVGESVYGDFREALFHLQKKLIATKKPEQIRGGGLLKYCNLLVRNYQPYTHEQIKNLERYMCSRFFIDFSDLGQQRAKLEGYLANHFVGYEHLKFDYLRILSRVVNESTVCLMGHERRQTLNLINELAHYVLYQDHQRLIAKQHHHFDHHYEHTTGHESTTGSLAHSGQHHGQHPQNPYMFCTGAQYFYTPYMPTHHQLSQTTTCFTPCQCGHGWMPCMTGHA